MDDLEPAINDELRIHPAEHQVFLSFKSDWEAAAFVDWFQSEGVGDFKAFAHENQQDYR